jgi:hypothetical protein
MYKIFREGGEVEPPKSAQVDSIEKGEKAGFRNGLSAVEISLQAHRLKIKHSSGKPVKVEIFYPGDGFFGKAPIEQTLGGWDEPRAITTLRRNVVIQSQGGEHKLVLIRTTPLTSR